MNKIHALLCQEGDGEPSNALDGIEEKKAQSADVMASVVESPESHFDTEDSEDALRLRWLSKFPFHHEIKCDSPRCSGVIHGLN